MGGATVAGPLAKARLEGVLVALRRHPVVGPPGGARLGTEAQGRLGKPDRGFRTPGGGSVPTHPRAFPLSPCLEVTLCD